MSQFRWNIQAQPDPEQRARYHGVPDVVASILWNRGIRSSDDIQAFFHPEYERHLHDPFLFTDMKMATELVIQTILAGEQIMVHGDYDADGVTTTALMVDALEHLGAKVSWYVPDRFTEGYGIRADTMTRFAEQGVKLLICVDCGTSNVEELGLAKTLGIQTIILDHHTPPATVPPALMINPFRAGETYPFTGHSSAGVAFTFLRGLLMATNWGEQLGHPWSRGTEKWYLDLVAISTVADLMPLRDENRLFVLFGLRVLRKTRRLGLRLLLNKIGVTGDSITEQTIGFHLAPRLNAAGRLQHAGLAVRLLLTHDPEQANVYVNELEQINNDRKRLTQAATDEAWEQLANRSGEEAAYAVFAPHWSPGVVGLVAGRLAEKLWKPVAVMTILDGQAVGSARAGININLMDVMHAGAHIFERYGGHAGASGFTLSAARREEFASWFVEQVGHVSQHVDTAKEIRIDSPAVLSDMNAELLTRLDSLAPFGVEHPRPVILIRDVELLERVPVGTDGQHVRLVVSDQSMRRSLIGFRFAEETKNLTPGSRIHVVVEPSWNVWNGRTDIQLRIIDIDQSA